MTATSYHRSFLHGLVAMISCPVYSCDFIHDIFHINRCTQQPASHQHMCMWHAYRHSIMTLDVITLSVAIRKPVHGQALYSS